MPDKDENIGGESLLGVSARMVKGISLFTMFHHDHGGECACSQGFRGKALGIKPSAKTPMVELSTVRRAKETNKRVSALEDPRRSLLRCCKKFAHQRPIRASTRKQSPILSNTRHIFRSCVPNTCNKIRVECTILGAKLGCIAFLLALSLVSSNIHACFNMSFTLELPSILHHG